MRTSTTLITLLVTSSVDAFFSPISMRTSAPGKAIETESKCPIQSMKRMMKITGNPEFTEIHVKPGLGGEEGDRGDDELGLDRMYFNLLHLPTYVFKIPFATVVGIWSSLLWRVPTEQDVVNVVEGTSLITVLHRDMSDLSGIRKGEERNYFVDVKECLLVHTNPEDVLNHAESWSMSYTKPAPTSEAGNGTLESIHLKSTGRS